MTAIRVSPALSARIREEASHGRNPIFSVSTHNSFAKDTLRVVLETSGPVEMAAVPSNIATSRMRLPQNSPVTTWRPGTSMANT